MRSSFTVRAKSAELERKRRRGPAEAQLAARDRALAKRKEQLDREQMQATKIELLSGGRSGIDSFVAVKKLINGDDW